VENVQRALRTGRILNIGAACVGVWAFFYPHPYILAFLAVAALPWLAMWLSHQYPGAFTVEDPGRNTVRADLTILVLLPGAVLMLRAISDFSLLDPIELILPTVVGLLAMLACLAWAGPLYRKKPRLLLVSAALLVAYPAGAIMIANAVFDYGTAMAYPVKVMKKRYTTGKGASQYVTVPAWGPVAEVNELEVSRDLYRATEVGQAICVRLHRGALGMEWTTIHPEAAC